MKTTTFRSAAQAHADLGPFALWQPAYAEHGIATFPIKIIENADKIEKKPAIIGYQKVGLRGSQQLAFKFTAAEALGFLCGPRSKISVGDVDITNERRLADFLDRHGATPIIVQTASDKYHAWYRYNGERRRIKPWPGLPFDILGGGFVVAPPSQDTLRGGTYRFIQGTLDDVDRLPVMRNLDAHLYANLDAGLDTKPALPKAVRGERNDKLFRHCMRAAHRVDTFDKLLDAARTFNEDCQPPMEDSEVTATAQSAWNYTQRGENRFGQHGAYFPYDEIAALIDRDQDAFLLLAFMRASQGPAATFLCANGLAERFGWTRQRLAAARHRLIDLGYLNLIRQAGRGHAAMFRWAK
jgi:hypothetical protein